MEHMKTLEILTNLRRRRAFPARDVSTGTARHGKVDKHKVMHKSHAQKGPGSSDEMLGIRPEGR